MLCAAISQATTGVGGAAATPGDHRQGEFATYASHEPGTGWALLDSSEQLGRIIAGTARVWLVWDTCGRMENAASKTLDQDESGLLKP